MVEAAIIYPLIIGAVMAVIYIIICMYMAMSIKSSINMELRSRAMDETQTGERIVLDSIFTPKDKYGALAFNKKIYVSEIKASGKKLLMGETTKEYSGNKMMTQTLQRSHVGAVFLIDEKDYIRKVDMLVK